MAGRNGEPVDLTGDDEMSEDEALRYAIELSMQDQDTDSKKIKSPAENPPDKGSGEPKEKESRLTQSAFGSLMLDRKAMEEERLKRLSAKRPRDASDAPEGSKPPQAKRQALQEPVVQSKPAKATPTTQPASSLQYPDGVVKKTWAYGYPRLGEDIKIEEVFQKEKLELAVLSSYQWDDEWMLSKIDFPRTKLLLLAYAQDEAQQQQMRANVPPNIKFSFPPMNGPGAMHSKLMVLKYADHLRIAVPTGNLVPYDWGETGVMENMVFLIDLPRLAQPGQHKPTGFSTELAKFLRASKIDDKMVSSLTNYDFARTEKLGFVYTIPGGHMDEFRRRTGYCALGDTVAGLGLANDAPIEVDIVAASLGSINNDLIGALYNACQGDNGMKEYNARIARKGGSKSATSPPDHLKDHLRIYFPTEQTVASSRGGRGAAGTICVQSKWWRSPSFPTGLVRDCASTRPGMLMHSKLIFVRPAGSSGGANDRPRGSSWAYVGSANLSESAWGRLVKDSKTNKPKMSCRNWECGVVLPVTPAAAVDKSTEEKEATTDKPPSGSASASAAASADANELRSVFASRVPVPMHFPGRPYGPTDEPWFYMSAR